MQLTPTQQSGLVAFSPEKATNTFPLHKGAQPVETPSEAGDLHSRFFAGFLFYGHRHSCPRQGQPYLCPIAKLPSRALRQWRKRRRARSELSERSPQRGKLSLLYRVSSLRRRVSSSLSSEKAARMGTAKSLSRISAGTVLRDLLRIADPSAFSPCDVGA